MTTDASDQLEIELRRLERDKRIEEIRQLKARGRAQWITPAALAAMVPLLAGLGLWVVGELKQYNEGYRALQEVDRLAAEKDALQAQKNNLNIEVSTLLDLKRHYAEQANELQAKFEERQQQLDATYARARFAAAEAGYALGHIEGLGPAPDAAALAALRQQRDKVPPEVAETLDQILERHGLAVEMIGISERILAAFGDTLELVPVSGWAAELEYMPSGSIAAGRNVMISQARRGDDHSRRYYDVDEGRFLLEEEVQAE
jgi:DNA repair exonuclease SbcCD ATPase subunit